MGDLHIVTGKRQSSNILSFIRKRKQNTNMSKRAFTMFNNKKIFIILSCVNNFVMFFINIVLHIKIYSDYIN